MLTAEAQVQTERPSRYLVQLCQHASKMGKRGTHQIPAHLTGDHRAPTERPAHVEAEWSETQGTISFDWGTCAVEATQDALLVRVEAADEENLRRIQEIITRDLTRFTKRDPVTVNWNRTETPSVQSGEVSSTAPAPTAKAAPPRGRRQAILLVLVGALAIGAHVALAAGLVAAPQWTGLTADLVLAAVAVKGLLIAAHFYRRRKAAKSR